MKCNLCPRRCSADREKSYGYCGVSEKIRVSRAALHYWEEPCISGKRGSGTVFFTGCSLRCIYCQNHEISFIRPGDKTGKELDIPGLIEIFHSLREQGAHNINLVTGDHFIPEIAKAVSTAKAEGFDLPFVFNCSGYETVESLKTLDGLIDVYLTDYKYEEKELAKAFSNAEDYPDIVKAALSEMFRQQPELKYNEEGILTKGVIVRNLLLPKHVMNSKRVLKYLYETYQDKIIISIMSQYTPINASFEKYPELKRKISRSEYRKITDYAIKLGMENAFIQELSSSGTEYIPAFNTH